MRISQFEAAEADMLLKASAILSIVNLAAAGVLTSVERLTSPNKVSETVSLDYGTFTGLKDTTNSVFAFKGVRFADAPVGNLRWRAPVSPPSKNLGKVDATQFRAVCVGATQSSVTSGTSEDCLFGNIYVPFTNSTQPLPVLVYFHGGGFQGGNSHDLPTAVWKDTSATPVIYVSFEYRLGALGFLAGSRLKADGVLNVGLIDQRTALRWVQRYIGNFGGDKSRVTIWGQSAGAGSTMFHLLGNGGNTEGLFRAAMGDSPSLNFQPEGTDDYAEGIFSQYASFANCPSTDAKVLDCLRSADINTLLSASVKFLATRPSVLYNFAPLVDGTYIKERAVEAFLGGRFARIPVLFGSNSDEGAGWSNGLSDPSANTSQANANETTVYNFLKGQYATFTNASVTKAFELYPLSDYSNSVSRQAQQMYGETRYICTAAMITGSATAVGQTAYQYHYNNPISGSTHSAELTAFFSSTTPSDPNNQALYTAMRQYYTSFVANGKPVAKNGVVWTPVSTTAGSSTAGAPRLLLQPGGIAMETLGSLADRCKFWHSLSGEMHT